MISPNVSNLQTLFNMVQNEYCFQPDYFQVNGGVNHHFRIEGSEQPNSPKARVHYFKPSGYAAAIKGQIK